MRTLNFRMDQRTGVALATFGLLAVSFVFGGASRQHELRLALVELSALPLAVIAIVAMTKKEPAPRHGFALGIMAAVILVPLLQLAPLPPFIWTGIPGREQLTLALTVSGMAPTWIPLSFTPDHTWQSALALLPPAAMFLGMLVSDAPLRTRLAHALVAGAVVAVVLGTAQLASGSVALYPWKTTAAGNVTGFFANRNHLATLCLISLPFAAVWGAGALRRREGHSGRLQFWLSVLVIGLIVIGLGVIRSRAGLILFGPVLVASLVAAWRASGRGQPKSVLLALAGGGALAVAAVVAFALGPVLERFDATGAREGRFENWPIVLRAAEAHLPLGSGIGSFDAIFRSVEPLERLDATYFNQAHNDYLEILLETGWLGVGVLAAFLIWFSRRTWTAWRQSASSERDLQRAASIAVAVVLLHSFVDYPLRTETLATVFAMLCGLLELAVRSDKELGPDRSRRRR